MHRYFKWSHLLRKSISILSYIICPKCYKAAYSHDGIHVASVGADKVLNYWDLRKTQKPIFSNNGKFLSAQILTQIFIS